MTIVSERGLVKLAPRLLNKLPARALISDHLSTIFSRTLDMSITGSDPETMITESYLRLRLVSN